MKAEIEIVFQGKWINLPVEYSYSAFGETATLDIVTVGTQDILDVLDTFQREYLHSLAQKDWDHHRECHRKSAEARASQYQYNRQDNLAQLREEVLDGDLVANNSGIR